MKIGGLQKFSLIDYPGKFSAVIFTQGCNFRCPYCHNPELVRAIDFKESLPVAEVLHFLEKRKNQLQGVVVTGGEPTLQKDLSGFIQQIKKMGYQVKLDTNGSKPDVLAKLINLKLVDYIAMDIKSPLEKYPAVTNSSIQIDHIKKSINLIQKSNIKHQFRTTVVKPYLDYNDLIVIHNLLQNSRNYILQPFCKRDPLLDDSLLTENQFSESDIQQFQKKLFPLN